MSRANTPVDDDLSCEAENEAGAAEAAALVAEYNLQQSGQTLDVFLSRGVVSKRPLISGLLYSRDLVAKGARRRNGKTTFLIDLAVSGARGGSFLGYEIPKPFKTLLLLLEDDPAELQSTLTRQLAGTQPPKGIALYTRDDFADKGIPIDGDDEDFRNEVRRLVAKHTPDLIVFDNLAQLIGAAFGDSERMHKLMQFAYELARDNDAAVIVAAHPRKQTQGGDKAVSLFEPDADLNEFFESIMGSSHFINSTGNLWGMERRASDDTTVFVGGRQRAEGFTNRSYLRLGDDKRFQIVADAEVNLALVIATEQRQKAWNALPDAPKTFGYLEAQRTVQNTRGALTSKSAYENWMAECVRVGVIVKSKDGKYIKTVKRTMAAKLANKLEGKKTDDDDEQA